VYCVTDFHCKGAAFTEYRKFRLQRAIRCRGLTFGWLKSNKRALRPYSLLYFLSLAAFPQPQPLALQGKFAKAIYLTATDCPPLYTYVVSSTLLLLAALMNACSLRLWLENLTQRIRTRPVTETVVKPSTSI